MAPPWPPRTRSRRVTIVPFWPGGIAPGWVVSPPVGLPFAFAGPPIATLALQRSSSGPWQTCCCSAPCLLHGIALGRLLSGIALGRLAIAPQTRLLPCLQIAALPSQPSSGQWQTRRCDFSWNAHARQVELGFIYSPQLHVGFYAFPQATPRAPAPAAPTVASCQTVAQLRPRRGPLGLAAVRETAVSPDPGWHMKRGAEGSDRPRTVVAAGSAVLEAPCCLC